MKRLALLILTMFVLFHGAPCAWSQAGDGDSSSSYSDSSSSDDGSTSSDGSTAGDDSTAGDGSSGDGSSSSDDKKDQLANLEALLNILGVWGLGAGVVTSGSLFLSGVIVIAMRNTKRWLGGILIVWSFLAFGGALMCPGLLALLMASAKDANLFS